MRRLLLALAALAVLLVLVDRVAVVYVERSIERGLQEGVGWRSDAQVRGVPFLSQALGRDLEQVQLSAGQARLGDVDITVQDLVADLYEVDVADLDAPVAGRFEARALVPFAELERRQGLVAGSLSGTRDGRLRYRTFIEPLGQRLELVVDTDPVVREDVVELVPGQVEVQGARIELPPEVRGQITERLQLRVPLAGLPPGAQVTQVLVRPEGVEVRLVGRDVPVGALTA